MYRYKFKRVVSIGKFTLNPTIDLLQKNCFDFDHFLSPTDTRVIVQDGELLSGYMCKKHIGNAANSFIHIVVLDFGNDVVKVMMKDIQIIMKAYSVYRTCSVGIKDMRVEPKSKHKVEKNINLAVEKLEEIKTQKITKREFEQRCNKMLNDARKKACEDTFEQLDENNALKLMMTAVSKGSIVNPPQMKRCLGQQNVEGVRIPNGFIDRTTPHFKKGDLSPSAKGFIKSNYMTGLSPQEAFFHAMAGREGLSDTAVKTSEIGYLQRRLCKAMEDIGVQYDGIWFPKR
jgi:DNA-directed RNA polymerase II subunit RPB1